MRWLALPLLALVAVIIFYSFSDNGSDRKTSFVNDLADVRTGAVPDDEPLSRERPEETEADVAGGTSEPGPREEQLAEDTTAAHFEISWVDYQPNPSQAIEYDALQRALDDENVDSNWGPLIEAAAMGSISANQTNLITLSAVCKTTLCKVEVEQAGSLPAPDSIEELFSMTEWLRDLADAVRETGKDYWRIQLNPGSMPNDEATSWDVWILRISP